MSCNRVFGPLALIILTLTWAYNWIVMKLTLTYISAVDFSALRAILGFLVLLLLLKITGRSLKPTPFWPSILIVFFRLWA